MSEAPVAPKPLSGRKGAVFMGDNFIELEDPAAVTLEDLCESFGTPWESGMHVRQRTTGRIVATLPFEPLPPLTEVADVVIKTEDATAALAASADASGMGAGTNSTNTNEDSEYVSDDEEAENSYAVVYDLVNANAPEMDESTVRLAGPLAANIRGIPGIEETMRQLVELGAAELLTAEPPSVVNGKREYNPVEAPGLLRRTVYPASQYSPYRAARDPVSDGKHTLFRSTAGSTSSPTSAAVAPYKTLGFVGEGGPYTSYLDSYAFGGRAEMPYVSVANPRNASLAVPLTNEEHLKIFGV
ncbi:hypothetical protein ABB37_03357 [Leptomonas pyrrhocoris]|uniref:Uncharacterized protein n=1 Tax=Leptomonas pyrrhocoris TaxID=157538 RepID=A0A0N0VG46_LEPPY|nr:hypothetical protein ABB37_03357 [Leptomonas pyrrhocoris]XP_015660684.1 hypothetical protein ABB37_03357 [Leptomonas pyrrhocoris]KPA82244.1 hypothetical protein ABB37_03357 [Leptomonas pyrrhocoris]KPA82245.1 hypothetical protein ABB37_03357 [Leptomonas pyrrhocoris]|eukprot:XP_015660683.1 hypothetical protein ABB37_03357 [Leptomonas pyrrhocoris]